ncbi:hypothetical protein WA158_001856 [Blastocystis sp. Blastoise]
MFFVNRSIWCLLEILSKLKTYSKRKLDIVDRDMNDTIENLEQITVFEKEKIGNYDVKDTNSRYNLRINPTPSMKRRATESLTNLKPNNFTRNAALSTGRRKRKQKDK